MLSTEIARTRSILVKRIKRLLHLDREQVYRSELRTNILPFLTSLGSVALIGGAIRDVARAGKRGFSSDLDFVIYGSAKEQFARAVEGCGGIRNKFGGYRLTHFTSQVDAWHLEDTWAKTAGYIDVSRPRDLLACTFFDWDSAIYELDAGTLTVPIDYLDRLRQNVMDIRLRQNPNPVGALIRALRRAALWSVKFGPELTEFSKEMLKKESWQNLVSIDGGAFPQPVLKYLRRDVILDQLEHVMPGCVTVPVPDWRLQLKLPVLPRAS